jgi:hypothetical protein
MAAKNPAVFKLHNRYYLDDKRPRPIGRRTRNVRVVQGVKGENGNDRVVIVGNCRPTFEDWLWESVELCTNENHTKDGMYRSGRGGWFPIDALIYAMENGVPAALEKYKLEGRDETEFG